MKRARSRILAGFAFCLISLGQAYPFSAAWGMSQKSHACCCSSAVAKPCDCDHKGHSPSTKKKFSCHEEKPKDGPNYAPAPCGATNEARSLNFRGEICLPYFSSFAIVEIETRHSEDLSVRLPKLIAVPEAPPPRQG